MVYAKNNEVFTREKSLFQEVLKGGQVLEKIWGRGNQEQKALFPFFLTLKLAKYV